MPVIRRDISIVVDAAADTETPGDRASAALGDRIDNLESVEVLNATAYGDLPRGARAGLMLRPDQAKALVRLRSPSLRVKADGGLRVCSEPRQTRTGLSFLTYAGLAVAS